VAAFWVVLQGPLGRPLRRHRQPAAAPAEQEGGREDEEEEAREPILAPVGGADGVAQPPAGRAQGLGRVGSCPGSPVGGCIFGCESSSLLRLAHTTAPFSLELVAMVEYVSVRDKESLLRLEHTTSSFFVRRLVIVLHDLREVMRFLRAIVWYVACLVRNSLKRVPGGCVMLRDRE
jgi:hypothetical protein